MRTSERRPGATAVWFAVRCDRPACGELAEVIADSGYDALDMLREAGWTSLAQMGDRCPVHAPEKNHLGMNFSI